MRSTSARRSAFHKNGASGTSKKKVDVENQWLKVKDRKGTISYVAAWLVSESNL